LNLGTFGIGYAFHDFGENTWTKDQKWTPDVTTKRDQRVQQGCMGIPIDELVSSGFMRTPDHIKIDVDGKLLEETPYEVNEAGFVIHSAIHMSRLDLHCVIHTHTVAGQAVSALDCGLLPLNQGSLRFYNRVGYHDHEGISRDLDERDRIVEDLGVHKVLVLRNHGLLTAGVNAAEAFNLMYHLEKSCQTQMMVLASSQPYSTAPPAICEKGAQQFHRGNRPLGQRDWPALMDLVDRLYPDFAQ
jgi:ribulose-5-phosphate 4-epimerase/fuculose-1-phosphate aldolase